MDSSAPSAGLGKNSSSLGNVLTYSKRAVGFTWEVLMIVSFHRIRTIIRDLLNP